MHKEVIRYTDYNGVERKEPFYFNMNEAELMEMQYGTAGGLDQTIKKIIATQDQGALINIFKKLVLDAYGVKSDDGRRFIKEENGHRLSDDFKQTPAYPILFMKLATDDEAAAKFVNEIIPSAVAKELETQKPKLMEQLEADE